MKANEKKFFLESEIGRRNAEECYFHIISAPYEKSVSYGHGTADGPEAIIEASSSLELFDGVGCPGELGVFTHEPVDCSCSDVDALNNIHAGVSSVLKIGKFPVLLGGEHTVTFPAVRAFKEMGNIFGVIHFDAHTDLRDSYEGDKLSHACVMRRVCELGVPIMQIGIRSLPEEDHLYRLEKKIAHYDSDFVYEKGIPDKIVPDNFPADVYVSIDVDVLDPSEMPSTGTPEPGGLRFLQLMSFLKKISSERKVIGFDVVELAPVQYLHFPDYATARLIYNFMGMISRK